MTEHDVTPFLKGSFSQMRKEQKPEKQNTGKTKKKDEKPKS